MFRITDDDEKLAREVREKADNDAFKRLYSRYKDRIYSYVRHLMNFDATQTDDIVADTFIQAYLYLQQQEVKNLKGFIYRTAHNIAINSIQKEQKQLFIEEKKHEHKNNNDHETMKEKTENNFRQKIMQEMLQNIEERYREVIYLCYFEGYDYEKIAEIIESNKNTVGTLLSRAKEQLKKIIRQHGYEDIFIS